MRWRRSKRRSPGFGGKSRAASLIWDALGDVPNFIEPFFGSGAVLLNRPHPPEIETVNDKDGFLANVFRALREAPEEVAYWCDRPVMEVDQHAIHAWLVGQREEFTARLMGDPDYYDAQVAGRWLYGICCWIGSGWCSGKGPWYSVDGRLVHQDTHGLGVHRQLIHLRNAGQGVHRKRIHLGNAGKGVHRKRVHLINAGKGVHRPCMRKEDGLYAWFDALAQRLRLVRVCCGDWARVLGPSVTYKLGLTGILFDPPYSAEEGRDKRLYTCDDLSIAHAVRDWCLHHGRSPLLRIVLCGYGEIHDALLGDGWTKMRWTAPGGMSNQNRTKENVNKYRETLWFSPHCLRERSQISLFGEGSHA